jgi:hypothetical protein
LPSLHKTFGSVTRTEKKKRRGRKRGRRREGRRERRKGWREGRRQRNSGRLDNEKVNEFEDLAIEIT